MSSAEAPRIEIDPEERRLEFESPRLELVQNYDSLPLNDYGGHPRTSTHHWRKYINDVDQEQRDERVLESPVEYFLEACGNYPPLSKEQERRELIAYRKGDMDAKERLILHNLRYVVGVAKKVRRNLDLPPDAMPDLLQFGVIGLTRAIERFDPYHRDEKGNLSNGRLVSLAGSHISRAMEIGHDNTSNTIRIPIHKLGEVRASQRAYAQLQDETGRTPSIEEVAERSNMSVSQLKELRNTTQQPISMDRYIAPDEDIWNSRHDIENPESYKELEEVTQIERNSVCREMLEHLSYRERRVLELRYGFEGLERTLEEVGRTFNVTRERVRQIENHALKKLNSLAEGREYQWRLMESNITPEDVRDKYEPVRTNAHQQSLSDIIAQEVREYTSRRHSILAQKKAEQERTEREKAHRALLNKYYDNAMQRRSIGDIDTAMGAIQTRQAFFEQHNILCDKLERQRGDMQWMTDFRDKYGGFNTNVFKMLHRAIDKLGRENTAFSSESAIQAEAETYSELFFDMRPEFVSALLAAAEDEGVLIGSYDNLNRRHYRLRTWEDEKASRPPDHTPGSINQAPPFVQFVYHTLRGLEAGRSHETGITFGRLRREWADSFDDIQETKLRLAMTYLKRGGFIQTRKHPTKGAVIWRSYGTTNLPRIKTHELWFEDK